MHDIVLASASPQRKRLLGQLVEDFKVVPGDVDESACEERDPVTRASLLAKMKAHDVKLRHPDAIVIGCDTLVVSSDGALLEKPRNEDEARTMLAKHSGNESTVHSALCVIGDGDESRQGVSTSTVRFKRLTPAEIDWWTHTGLWKGRSGGFQIEGKGQVMIERIEGDWPGVVGLPLHLLHRFLTDLGRDVTAM